MLSLLCSWALGGELPIAARVTNPASGAKLAVYLDAPPGAGPFPAMVLAPGGAHGARFIEEERVAAFVAGGFAVVRFDPDGRGRSEGTEDFNGPTGQAGMGAVIRWAIDRPEIADDRVGVVSWSFGVVLAMGALAGEPPGEPPVVPGVSGSPRARWLLDYEGPPERSDMRQCRSPGRADPRTAHDCADDAYWTPREALTYVARIGVPYHRVQFDDRHGADAPDELGQARRILAAAQEAGLWTRFDDERPEVPASGLKRLMPLPEDELYARVLRYAQALDRMTQ